MASKKRPNKLPPRVDDTIESEELPEGRRPEDAAILPQSQPVDGPGAVRDYRPHLERNDTGRARRG